jgi:N-acetylmuramoyl-L-alanine amidase
MAWIVMLLILCCLCSTARFAQAATPEQAFQESKAVYQAARKNDPRVNDPVRWERAGSALQAFLNEYPATARSGEALFLLGRLYEAIYRERKDRAALSKALFYYDALTRNQPGHALADEALLSLGDLRQSALRDSVGARAAYYEIIDRYPQSESVSAARERVGEEKPQMAKTPLAKEEETPAVVLPQPPEKTESREVYVAENSVRRPLIVIDPGHGGEDKGAAGGDTVLEKEIVLNIGKMLEELLRERLRARTLLTRSEDIFIPLAERTKFANDQKADLFVSIHANASEYKTASGIETYYLDNTEDKSSLRLAERENRSMLIGGKPGEAADLSFMLSDFIQSAKLADSISLAHHLQNSLVETLSRYYRSVNDLGVKKAPFYVLVGAHMPCVLIEVSFIDHPVEGKNLADPRYQRLVALALYQGMKTYFTKRS